MDVIEMSPVKVLGKRTQELLKRDKLFVETDWCILCQLLEDYQVEQEIVIPKYRVGAPYKFRLRGIVKGSTPVVRAEMNERVMLLVIPLAFSEQKHMLEIQQALGSAKMLAAQSPVGSEPIAVAEPEVEAVSLLSDSSPVY